MVERNITDSVCFLYNLYIYSSKRFKFIEIFVLYNDFTYFTANSKQNCYARMVNILTGNKKHKTILFFVANLFK